MLKTLLNFLLIALLFIATLGYVAYQLVRPGFLISQAEKVHLYEQTTSQIGSFLPKDATKGSAFSPSDIQAILTKAIDAPTFYADLGGVTGSYLNYLTGRSTSLNYQLNLVPIKSRIASVAKATIIANYQALPTCKASELKTWDASNTFPSCQLPGTNVQTKDVNNLLGSQVDKMLANFPDQLRAPAPTDSLQQTRARVIQIFGLIRIAWLTTLVFILLYVLIWRKKAFWPLALIFLIVGALEVGFSLIAWDWLKRVVIDLINHPDTSQQMVAIIGTLVDDVVQTLKTILGNLSIITLSLGGLFLILWGFSHFGRPKNNLELPKS